MFDDYMALAEGREFNKESIKAFYTKMAEHIKQEKQRIGGSNWAVAQAVPFQWLRQHIKEKIADRRTQYHSQTIVTDNEKTLQSM